MKMTLTIEADPQTVANVAKVIADATAAARRRRPDPGQLRCRIENLMHSLGGEPDMNGQFPDEPPQPPERPAQIDMVTV